MKYCIPQCNAKKLKGYSTESEQWYWGSSPSVQHFVMTTLTSSAESLTEPQMRHYGNQTGRSARSTGRDSDPDRRRDGRELRRPADIFRGSGLTEEQRLIQGQTLHQHWCTETTAETLTDSATTHLTCSWSQYRHKLGLQNIFILSWNIMRFRLEVNIRSSGLL